MATALQDNPASVVPARLAFLAIYNPSLGRTDETFRDQVVFYHSREVHVKRKHHAGSEDKADALQQEENEQLRQIGLAQGMVNFAQNFANGSNLDTVETEKSRIVLHELEKGWWILASIDYTRIPVPPSASKTSSVSSDTHKGDYEYSSRDLSPSALLTEQLLQAHSVFRLHNGSSLGSIFSRNSRTKFCALLDRFWTRFAVKWNVLLHGVPATDIFGGMRLAAGGELGIGLGEEEWGCGEREVLEDFVSRTDGLVDLLVCRYGDPLQAQERASRSSSAANTPDEPWLGIGSSSLSSDGVIFSGVGAVARSFMRDLSFWLQLIYTNGEHAYAVKESSTSAGKRRKHKNRDATLSSKDRDIVNQHDVDPPVGIPRSIVSAAEKSLQSATSRVEKKSDKKEPAESKTSNVTQHQPNVPQDETWKKVLKLGYGYSWGFTDNNLQETEQEEQPVDKLLARINDQVQKENAGYFLIGLQGNLEDDLATVGEDEEQEAGNSNRRIMIRTIHMQKEDRERPNLNRLATDQSQASFSGVSMSSAAGATERIDNRLRVLIYVHRPFIYALLFRPDSSSLMMPTFYRDLHTFLSPLHPLLLRRTGPEVGAARRRQAINDSRHEPAAGKGSDASSSNMRNAWEVIYDPSTLTTIANVPSVDEESSIISRGDALNLHFAALEVLSSIQQHEVERRVKTSKGWWVGWAKVSPTREDNADERVASSTDEHAVSSEDPLRSDSDMTVRQPVIGRNALRNCRQILLFRRANDVDTRSRTRVVSDWGLTAGRAGASNTKLDAGDLGIGFDAKRYVEGIMGINK